MDLKYFLAQFQFCYSVHKKIRNGQRRVFAGSVAGDVSAMIRSTKARSSVRVFSGASNESSAMFSQSQRRSPLFTKAFS